MFVTIDPGEQTGWSIWSHALVACGLGDPRSSSKHVVWRDESRVDQISDVWIESQVIYPRSKARPRDILKLAQDAGRWAGIYGTLGVDAHFVEPAQWKGQVPKHIHHPRIWAALSPDEQEIVRVGCRGLALSKRHNVIDAVGLGLWVRRQMSPLQAGLQSARQDVASGRPLKPWVLK